MKKIIVVLFVMGIIFGACSTHNNSNNDTDAKAVWENGQHVFINNCVSCHATYSDMDTGPKLDSVFIRWNNDSLGLASFIKNSQQVISNGQNTYAVNLYHSYNNALMPIFSNLSDKDIKSVLFFIHHGPNY